MIEYINFKFIKSKPNKKLTRSYIFLFIKPLINQIFKFLLIIILSINKIKYIAICQAKK